MPRSMNENRRIVSGHQWGVQLQREIDVLVAGTQGIGLSTTMLALATEAVIADTGRLCDSTGTPGYAWQPEVYERKANHDPVTARIRAAGSSLGRVLAGGHPSHRAYLAFLEAVYVVTTQQSYDVAERIEKLWDEAERMRDEIDEPEEDETPRRKPWTARLRDWLRRVGLWV